MRADLGTWYSALLATILSSVAGVNYFCAAQV